MADVLVHLVGVRAMRTRKTDRRQGAMAKEILTLAQGRPEFTRRCLAKASEGERWDSDSLRGMLRFLARTGKLELVRAGVSGRRGSPPVYRVVNGKEKT